MIKIFKETAFIGISLAVITLALKKSFPHSEIFEPNAIITYVIYLVAQFVLCLHKFKAQEVKKAHVFMRISIAINTLGVLLPLLYDLLNSYYLGGDFELIALFYTILFFGGIKTCFVISRFNFFEK